MPLMAKLSDFRLGADVLGADGEQAGTLVSVLVDEKGFDPRALVVKNAVSLVGRLVAEEKLFVTDEVVVPIADVASATREMVRLNISADEVRRQPAYISYRFRSMETGTAVLEEAGVLGGGLGLPRAQEVANKPKGEIEIARDENVMLGTTGRRLGRVREVLVDEGELVGVVIRPEGFFKRDVVLPVRFVSRADDLALFANLDEADVERLQPFQDAG
jgi:uncharacterized protein YrrD